MWPLRPRVLGSNPGSVLSSCVSLDEVSFLFELQFPHRQNIHNNDVYFTGLNKNPCKGHIGTVPGKQQHSGVLGPAVGYTLVPAPFSKQPPEHAGVQTIPKITGSP